MEQNLKYIRSKLIDGELLSTKFNRVLTLKKNDQALLRFCIDRLTDDETIDFCNLILLTADLTSDRFSFSCYYEYYCYEIVFEDTVRDSSYLGIFLDKFPNDITLTYISYSEESVNRTEIFKFTNLENAEQIINEFMHQIYQSKEN